MFIAAGDPNEAQIKDSQVHFLSEIRISLFILFTRCKQFFVELFCTPESSLKNPSLRVSGHGGSTNRTFIVEDYPEDEYRQWATDEAPGEQGYIDDERSCFWTWDDNEQAWQSSQFKSAKLKEEKVKE